MRRSILCHPVLALLVLAGLNLVISAAANKPAAQDVVYRQKAVFLGVFTHLEPRHTLAEKLASLEQLVRDNPHVAGIT